MENKIRVIEWFGGIGASSKALKNIGLNLELVDYVELDKNSVKSFNAIHGTTFEPQDINDVDVSKYGEVDLLIAGWPCQSVSVAGKQKGLINGEPSGLIWVTLKKISEMKTKPKYILLENVKGLLGKKFTEDFLLIQNEFKKLGYKWTHQLLNAKYFGVPQNRERVYCVLSLEKKFNWDWAENFNEVTKNLKDILDEKAEWLVAKTYGEKFKYIFPDCDKKYIDMNSSFKRTWNIDNGIVGTVPASNPPKISKKIHFKNELNNYNGKKVEVDLEALENQTPGEINKVATLDIKFQNATYFLGVNGISGTIRVAEWATFCSKILKREREREREREGYFNIPKINTIRMLKTHGIPRWGFL